MSPLDKVTAPEAYKDSVLGKFIHRLHGKLFENPKDEAARTKADVLKALEHDLEGQPEYAKNFTIHLQELGKLHQEGAKKGWDPDEVNYRIATRMTPGNASFAMEWRGLGATTEGRPNLSDRRSFVTFPSMPLSDEQVADAKSGPGAFKGGLTHPNGGSPVSIFDAGNQLVVSEYGLLAMPTEVYTLVKDAYLQEGGVALDPPVRKRKFGESEEEWQAAMAQDKIPFSWERK